MMISCKNITKVFSEQVVIDSFSYNFNEYGLYLLFGESGSGKTTFLNILSGFLPFDNGEITWGGHTFTGKVNNSAIKNDFDYITQDAFFVDFLSVMDNMRLITDDDAKIVETLKSFGLEGKADQDPVTLSGGERQRLAIVRSILSNKKVIFLDEPTASLDEENKESVFELLTKLKRSTLIICSSHDEKASDYADEVIHFSKVKRQVSEQKSITLLSNSKPSRTHKRSKEKLPEDRKKKSSIPFLRKWFTSNRRSKRSTVMFGIVLVLAMCLCFLADTPQNKIFSTAENLLDVNSVIVNTVNGTKWSDIALRSDYVKEAVLQYNGSVPIVPEGIGAEGDSKAYEMFDVLPEDGSLFRLSDKLMCGTYFTDKNQVIVPYVMASYLSSDPQKLIGMTLTKEIYGLGTVELEIVGVLGEYNAFDREYMKSAGLSPNANRLMISSELMKELEENETFFSFGNNGRSYTLFFRSFKDAKRYYKELSEDLSGNDNAKVTIATLQTLTDTFEVLFYVTLPVAFLIVMFTAFFFVSLKRIEFVHNSRFVSVFEYSGYSKRKVIDQFILLNILDFIKLFAVSSLIAVALTSIVNIINKQAVLIYFQIFSYNIIMIAAFMLIMIAFLFVFANLFFRKVKVRSWYENMISGRDLL